MSSPSAGGAGDLSASGKVSGRHCKEQSTWSWSFSGWVRAFFGGVGAGLVAPFVTPMPTTMGALLSAVGIAASRLLGAIGEPAINVLALKAGPYAISPKAKRSGSTASTTSSTSDTQLYGVLAESDIIAIRRPKAVKAQEKPSAM